MPLTTGIALTYRLSFCFLSLQLEEVRRTLDEQMRALETVHRQAQEAVLRAARTEELLSDDAGRLARVPDDSDNGRDGRVF